MWRTDEATNAAAEAGIFIVSLSSGLHKGFFSVMLLPIAGGGTGDMSKAGRRKLHSGDELLPDAAEDVPPADLPQPDTLGSYIRYGILQLLIGFAVLLGVISLDSMRRVSNPNVSGAPAAEYAQRPEFLYHVGLEIGLALMIAGIVALSIDAASRRSQTKLLEAGMSRIGSDVFQGVYGIYHDPAYVKAVIGTCLAIRHIREEYDVYCEVSEFTDEERTRWGIDPGSLVKVDAEVTYFSKNISNRDGIFPGRYFIPRGFGKAGDLARLNYLEVGDQKYESDDQLAVLELPETHPNYSDSERGYQFPIPANSRKATKVHLRATFAKERSDNEIFTFLKPTIGAKIKFRFNIPGLTIGVTARTATTMATGPEILPGHSVSWEVRDGALLPNNHITIWWQTNQVSRASTDSTGVTALEEATVGMLDVEVDETAPTVGEQQAKPSGLRGLIKRATGALARLRPSGSDTPT